MDDIGYHSISLKKSARYLGVQYEIIELSYGEQRMRNCEEWGRWNAVQIYIFDKDLI
jgi:hypothetical protein